MKAVQIGSNGVYQNFRKILIMISFIPFFQLSAQVNPDFDSISALGIEMIFRENGSDFSYVCFDRKGRVTAYASGVKNKYKDLIEYDSTGLILKMEVCDFKTKSEFYNMEIDTISCQGMLFNQQGLLVKRYAYFLEENDSTWEEHLNSEIEFFEFPSRDSVLVTSITNLFGVQTIQKITYHNQEIGRLNSKIEKWTSAIAEFPSGSTLQVRYFTDFKEKEICLTKPATLLEVKTEIIGSWRVDSLQIKTNFPVEFNRPKYLSDTTLIIPFQLTLKSDLTGKIKIDDYTQTGNWTVIEQAENHLLEIPWFNDLNNNKIQCLTAQHLILRKEKDFVQMNSYFSKVD